MRMNIIAIFEETEKKKKIMPHDKLIVFFKGIM